MRIRIRGGRILTQDEGRRVLEGDVLVEDGRIAAIGTVKGRVDETVDARGKLVLPGLVNTHTHLPMVLFRGYGDDLPLDEWLRTRIWPAEDRMKEADMRVGARLAFLEMIGSGTTAFNDMYFHEDAIAQEADKAGLRGWCGFGMVDVGKVKDDEPNPRLKECEASMKKWAAHPRVRTNPAPHAAYTCGPATFARAYELAEAHGGILHTHLSETRSEVYDVQKARGARPPEFLARAKALGPRTVAAHCGWITKEEVRALARAGVRVSHNPVSNMKLATGGNCPVPELLESGVAVGLGTDGAASNNTLDLFETMKFTSLLHKHLRWDPRVLPAQAVLDLATRGGARTLGWEEQVGSLEAGKRADLVVVDPARPRMQPLFDPVSQLVYAAHGDDVSMTMVEGEILMLDQEYRTLKPARIVEEARKSAARLTQARVTPTGA